MVFSVIICTYNREDFLRKTLESFFDQGSLESLDYELVLVDNNSTDNTKGVVREFEQKYPIKYYFEKRQGLSIARNSGIKEARGDVIAFTDDDVLFDKDWLLGLSKVFTKYVVDAVGGRILPLYPQKTPQWVKDNHDILSGPIVSYDYGEETKAYNKEEMTSIVGANMVFSREVFGKCGYFREDLGAGTGVVGEDSDIFRRVLAAGLKIYYSGECVVFHPVEASRMSFLYIAKWKISSGKTVCRTKISSKEGQRLFAGIPLWCIKEAIGKFFSLIFSVFNHRQFIKNWCQFFLRIGFIIELQDRIKESNIYI